MRREAKARLTPNRDGAKSLHSFREPRRFIGSVEKALAAACSSRDASSPGSAGERSFRRIVSQMRLCQLQPSPKAL